MVEAGVLRAKPRKGPSDVLRKEQTNLGRRAGEIASMHPGRLWPSFGVIRSTAGRNMTVSPQVRVRRCVLDGTICVP
jgi:hypothetical protein